MKIPQIITNLYFIHKVPQNKNKTRSEYGYKMI